MDDRALQASAFANLPANQCAITQRYTDDPVVMHRDLSDWWPPSLHDMRDDRLVNLIIVDRAERERYYNKLKKLTVVLAYSGGLDSTTVLHWCLRLFGSVHCLIFDYGQRHVEEIESAKRYIAHLFESSNPAISLSHCVVNMKPIGQLTNSSLTSPDIEVPKGRNVDEMSSSIPNTFVPGRNIYFSTALAQVAFMDGGRHVALGVNAVDYSGYPDCRPEFYTAMQQVIRIGIFNGMDIAFHTPLMRLHKKDIIRLGMYLGVDYSKTHSCYEGTPGGCGVCDSCVIRCDAFSELGLRDPAIASEQC